MFFFSVATYIYNNDNNQKKSYLCKVKFCQKKRKTTSAFSREEKRQPEKICANFHKKSYQKKRTPGEKFRKSVDLNINNSNLYKTTRNSTTTQQHTKNDQFNIIFNYDRKNRQNFILIKFWKKGKFSIELNEYNSNNNISKYVQYTIKELTSFFYILGLWPPLRR